jgi:hypothetical protein
MEVQVLSKNGLKAVFSTTPGQTVQDLLNKVSLKFHYPQSSIRLFYSGRELKPMSATLEKFEIGKHGNFLLHLSTTTIEIFDSTEISNSTISRFDHVDLTAPALIDQQIDLTTTPPISQQRKEKRRFVNFVEEGLRPIHIIPIKRLRVNISRALNHRLCILENWILYSSQSSNQDEISVEFLVQDPGVSSTFLVRVDLEVTCTCDHPDDCACQHILFILMKVDRLL